MSDDLSSVSLSRETLRGSVAKFLMAAIGFAGTIVFGRVLGPSLFGTYYELLSLAQIGSRPLTGWGGAAKKRISEAGTRRRELVGANYLGTVVWIFVAVAVIAVAASSVEAYAGHAMSPLLVALMLVPLAAFESLNVLVTGTGRVSATKWIDTLRSVLTLGGQLALVVAGYGVLGMAVGFAVATALTLPVLAWFLGVRPSLPSAETVRSLSRYAKFSIPAGVVGMTYELFDIILLGALFTSDATGYYKAAAVLTLPGFFVSEVASEGLMSKVSHAHSHGERVSEHVSNVLAFASVVSLPVLFGGAALSTPLVTTLFEADYAPAAGFFLPLAAARVIGTQVFPLYQAMEGLDRPDVALRIGSFALAVNIVLGYALAVQIGPLGVVYATLTAKIAQYAAYRWTLSKHTTDVHFLTRPFLHQLLAAVVMFLVVRALREVVPITGWPVLVALVGAGAVVYGLILLAISRQLRTTLRSALTD